MKYVRPGLNKYLVKELQRYSQLTLKQYKSYEDLEVKPKDVEVEYFKNFPDKKKPMYATVDKDVEIVNYKEVWSVRKLKNVVPSEYGQYNRLDHLDDKELRPLAIEGTKEYNFRTLTRTLYKNYCSQTKFNTYGQWYDDYLLKQKNPYRRKQWFITRGCKFIEQELYVFPETGTIFPPEIEDGSYTCSEEQLLPDLPDTPQVEELDVKKALANFTSEMGKYTRLEELENKELKPGVFVEPKKYNFRIVTRALYKRYCEQLRFKVYGQWYDDYLSGPHAPQRNKHREMYVVRGCKFIPSGIKGRVDNLYIFPETGTIFPPLDVPDGAWGEVPPPMTESILSEPEIKPNDEDEQLRLALEKAYAL